MADKRISQLVERTDIANNDVVPIVASGATTTNKATISSIQTFMQDNLDVGVTSVGVTLGSTGTDVSVTGSPITTSGNITINIPTASATNRGLLSAADWTTFNNKANAADYVTLGTVQTITAQKTFTTSGSSDTMIISHGSGSGFALDVLKAGSGEAIRVTKTSGSGNAMTVIGGNFEAPAIVKTGGTSAQFLKADGSVDGNTYITTASVSAAYVPYTGANSSVNLGQFNLAASSIRVDGPDVGLGSYLGFKHSTSVTTGASGYTSMYTFGTNTIGFKSVSGATTKDFSFSMAGITAGVPGGRTYTLPDADGTLALTSNLGAYLPLAGGTLTGALNGTSAAFTNSGAGIGVGVTNSGSGDGVKITHSAGRAFNIQSSGAGFGVIINNETESTSAPFTIQKQGTNKVAFTDAGAADFSSSVTASSFVKLSGTSSQFLKADGSVDSSTYLTTGSAASTYLPLAGGSLTGGLAGTSASFSSDVQTSTRFIAANPSGEIRITPNFGGTTNRIESFGSLPLALVSSQAITLAAGGATPQITLATGGGVTLTGALNGTSAAFSGGVIVTGSNPSYGTDNNTSYTSLVSYLSGTRSWQFDNVSNNFQLYMAGSLNTYAFNIASSTGAATFSSSVTAAQITINAQNDGTALFANRGGGVNTFALNTNADSSWTLFDHAAGSYTAGITQKSGNVGIGTDSPFSQGTSPTSLEIAGANFGQLFVSANSGAARGTLMARSATGDVYIGAITNSPLAFGTNDTERMRITSDAYLRMASGSGGIQFNGDTAAANALDDYEEGTWTPVLNGEGGNPTVSYLVGFTGGIYTKVGNVVTISFEVRWSSISGGSGAAFITGLPFTRRNTYFVDGDRLAIDSYNNTINGLYLIGNIGVNTSSIGLSMVRSGDITINLNISNLGNTSVNFLRGSATYFV